jgi:hypothetical protein
VRCPASRISCCQESTVFMPISMPPKLQTAVQNPGVPPALVEFRSQCWKVLSSMSSNPIDGKERDPEVSDQQSLGPPAQRVGNPQASSKRVSSFPGAGLRPGSRAGGLISIRLLRQLHSGRGRCSAVHTAQSSASLPCSSVAGDTAWRCIPLQSTAPAPTMPCTNDLGRETGCMRRGGMRIEACDRAGIGGTLVSQRRASVLPMRQEHERHGEPSAQPCALRHTTGCGGRTMRLDGPCRHSSPGTWRSWRRHPSCSLHCLRWRLVERIAHPDYPAGLQAARESLSHLGLAVYSWPFRTH